MIDLVELYSTTFPGWDPGPGAIDPIQQPGRIAHPWPDLFWWLR